MDLVPVPIGAVRVPCIYWWLHAADETDYWWSKLSSLSQAEADLPTWPCKSFPDHLQEQAEKCKQQISSKFKDKKVMGYYTAQDRPEFQSAIAHVIAESKNYNDVDGNRKKAA